MACCGCGAAALFASRSCRWLDGFGCQPQLGALRRIQMNSAISSGGRHPVECRATPPWSGREKPALQPGEASSDANCVVNRTLPRLEARFCKSIDPRASGGEEFQPKSVYKARLASESKPVPQTQSPTRGCITRRNREHQEAILASESIESINGTYLREHRFTSAHMRAA